MLRLGTLILTVLTLVVVMVNLFHTATEVTVIQIEEKLEQIGELATASFTYTGQQRIENTRDFLGLFQIPLTTNHLDITYTGVIKVGYTVSDIGIRVDESARAICITLPKARVLDNYILHDELLCTAGNNILNPLDPADVNRYLSSITYMELKRAEQQGIYETAEEQVTALITDALAAFPQYQIIFE